CSPRTRINVLSPPTLRSRATASSSSRSRSVDANRSAPEKLTPLTPWGDALLSGGVVRASHARDARRLDDAPCFREAAGGVVAFDGSGVWPVYLNMPGRVVVAVRSFGAGGVGSGN